MANYLRTLFCTVVASLLFATPGFAEIVRLTWNANTEPNLSGYRLAYGTSPGVHPTTVDVGNQTTAQVTGLVPGQRYYFVVRAYATDGTQSGPSNEVSGVALSVVSLTSTAILVADPDRRAGDVDRPRVGRAIPRIRVLAAEPATGTWTVVRPYSARIASRGLRRLGEEGNYVIRAWARVPGSSEPFDARRETSPFAVGERRPL